MSNVKPFRFQQHTDRVVNDMGVYLRDLQPQIQQLQNVAINGILSPTSGTEKEVVFTAFFNGTAANKIIGNGVFTGYGSLFVPLLVNGTETMRVKSMKIHFQTGFSTTATSAGIDYRVIQGGLSSSGSTTYATYATVLYRVSILNGASTTHPFPVNTGTNMLPPYKEYDMYPNNQSGLNVANGSQIGFDPSVVQPGSILGCDMVRSGAASAAAAVYFTVTARLEKA